MSILKIGFQGSQTNRRYEVGNYVSGREITSIVPHKLTVSGNREGGVYHVQIDDPTGDGKVVAAVVNHDAETGIWSYIENDLRDLDPPSGLNS